MWFHLRAIKEVHQHEYSIDAIITMPDEVVLLQFLQQYKILAISHNLYDKDPQSFGDVYGSIARENQHYDFIVHDMSISDTIRTMLFLGLDVVSINSYSTPIDIKESMASIKNITQEVQALITDQEKHIQEELSSLQKVYDDPHSDSIQKSITKILQDSDFAQKTYTQNPDIAQKLSLALDDLKKMRLSKNTEKLQGIIYQIYSYIDTMEQGYIQTLPHTAISSETTIQLPLFVRLYNKRERAQKIAHIHGSSFYGTIRMQWMTRKVFGQFLLYDMQKGFVGRWSHAPRVLNSLLLIATISTIAIIVSDLWLAIFAQLDFADIVAYKLLRIGLLGAALWMGYGLGKKTLRHTGTILLISIAIFVCLYYISRRLFLL